MTDAAHMLSDFAGFMISLFAIWVAMRPATKQLSYGWYRAGQYKTLCYEKFNLLGLQFRILSFKSVVNIYTILIIVFFRNLVNCDELCKTNEYCAHPFSIVFKRFCFFVFFNWVGTFHYISCPKRRGDPKQIGTGHLRCTLRP